MGNSPRRDVIPRGPVADFPRRMPTREAPGIGFSAGHRSAIATVAAPGAEDALAERPMRGPAEPMGFPHMG
jgi:hypothetical protein